MSASTLNTTGKKVELIFGSLSLKKYLDNSTSLSETVPITPDDHRPAMNHEPFLLELLKILKKVPIKSDE